MSRWLRLSTWDKESRRRWYSLSQGQLLSRRDKENQVSRWFVSRSISTGKSKHGPSPINMIMSHNLWVINYDFQKSSCKTCPVGHWCAKGSEKPVPCEEGTFSNFRNLTRPSACEWCTGKNRKFSEITQQKFEFLKAGMYCSHGGLNKPTGHCQQGFYCPKKSVSSRRYTCPRGHFCPSGTSEPIKCPVGTFNQNLGAYTFASCKKCDNDLYCYDQGQVRPVYSIVSAKDAQYRHEEEKSWWTSYIKHFDTGQADTQLTRPRGQTK